MQPYTLIESSGAPLPLVVDSPHSGRIYPVDFEFSCPLPLLRQAEDAFVDELVAGAATAGAAVLMAEFPRAMIDPNRAADDIDPSIVDGAWDAPLSPTPMTLQGYGLVRRLCRNGVVLYKAPLPAAEIKRRIDVYYQPYHDCLRGLVAARLAAHDLCYLVNAHSMPDRVDNGVARADFILGDRDGTSCDPAFTRRAQKLLQDMGYRVVLNDPYKGREIVQRYGRAGQGAQALQIEINRRLYLNEKTGEKNNLFDRLRVDMDAFFRALADSIADENRDRLAAE
ncbi:MAG: N-formylglutamate amidohydrolase [Alphaproteobacteria bacterium]|nr:N-formylglutamate amidohydrolase [Alphaproteobacteria bacterium]